MFDIFAQDYRIIIIRIIQWRLPQHLHPPLRSHRQPTRFLQISPTPDVHDFHGRHLLGLFKKFSALCKKQTKKKRFIYSQHLKKTHTHTYTYTPESQVENRWARVDEFKPKYKWCETTERKSASRKRKLQPFDYL